MSQLKDTAADSWEIEQRAGGQVMKPVYMVIIRKRERPRTSVVKVTSSSFMSAQRYAEQLNGDLYLLSNEEFVEKYELRRAA